MNLNICEAHAFNTVDRFSLDVFVVNGWSGQARTSCKHGREHEGDLVVVGGTLAPLKLSVHTYGCAMRARRLADVFAKCVLFSGSCLRDSLRAQEGQKGPATQRRASAVWKSYQQGAPCLVQGTEDLEEVLSERLQQLPPPLSVHGGGASPIREEGTREGPEVQPGDDLPAEPNKARDLQRVLRGRLAW